MKIVIKLLQAGKGILGIVILLNMEQLNMLLMI